MSSCPLSTHSLEGETGRRETTCLTIEVLLQEAKLLSSTIDTQDTEEKKHRGPRSPGVGL